jgi:hypothetical protein
MQEKTEFSSRGKDGKKRCRSSYYCVVFSTRVFLSNQQFVLSFFLLVYLAESEVFCALGVCYCIGKPTSRLCRVYCFLRLSERAVFYWITFCWAANTEQVYRRIRQSIRNNKHKSPVYVCGERRSSSFLFTLLYDSSGARGGCSSRLKCTFFIASRLFNGLRSREGGLKSAN